MKQNYKVIGAMAGSSMDGLDMAMIHFQMNGQNWTYEIERAETIPYDSSIYEKLSASKEFSSAGLKELDIEFGEWIGLRVNEFDDLKEVDLLALHGHTAVHSPFKGISWQLGEGDKVANMTGIPTVTEFRSLDISLGGEGAPLVPYGDFTLFNDYGACLNLGGIANISYRDKMIAWDICPCNQVLNYFARRLGHEYDKNGELSRLGHVNEKFISSIQQMGFFKKKAPKSLANDFIPHELLAIDPQDGLRSYTSFIARQLARDVSSMKIMPSNILVTGGGAFNHFLIEEIKTSLSGWDVIIPDSTLVSFKEALIFGLLGLKCHLGEINVLSSVTGGRKDSSSGVIHLPK